MVKSLDIEGHIEEYKRLKKVFDEQSSLASEVNARIKVRLEAQEKWKAEALEKYGTSDTGKLQELLEERHLENKDLLRKFEDELRDQRLAIDEATRILEQ